MWVLIEVINPPRVERTLPLYSMNLVALSSKNSARKDPSWPVMPVISAFHFCFDLKAPFHCLLLV